MEHRAVNMEASATSGAAPAAAAGSQMGSAVGSRSAAPPSTGTTAAAERRRDRHSDDPESLNNRVQQLAKDYLDVANKLKVHARREDISVIRAWARARASESERASFYITTQRK